ncbi:GNAT family N-acetyltransferase [Roseibium salinum]|uniref:GNAT family N-acetyltransferase n=2 Tax=Roseibium salinum TaxID=1604349 RepID=A0ABT3R5E9_9HYPH|nr:GNAT family N-acetyltransferase [Roseibium sp. DSM 29163]MCX2724280.1 GNAT family N-acetyltransferase [Roseibium sp. DSM 29163]
MSDVEIRTQRLALRRPRPQDLERCAELLGDYEVARMLSRVPYPYDIELGRRFITSAMANWSDPVGAEELSFHVDRDGEMVGGLSFKELQETPKIGYWLGRPYWGKGFISEAAGAAVAWLFGNTGHERIVCEAMTENPASLKVAEKLGFRVIGEVGCASVSRGGTVPAIRTELTRTDFLNGLSPQKGLTAGQ